MSEKPDLRSMLPEELEAFVRSLDLPAFRAKQIRDWLQKGADSFDDFKNLPRDLIEKLKEHAVLSSLRPVRTFVSADGTVKYLFALGDGHTVESVLMRYRHGNTLCVSTQVGCRMGCAFCATGLSGFARNLLPGEMLGQIHAASKDSGLRISNVVLMGMGEPLDNFDNVAKFLKLLILPGEYQIGARHISLSTCGIVPGIRRLAELGLQITLSVSLHAPNDEIRERTMPVNRKWGVDELLKSCQDFIRRTGRRVTFEYALVRGINDGEAHAEELARRLKGMLCHVNLIPVNPVAETGFAGPPKDAVRRFEEILRTRGIGVTVRRTLGSDIGASCGQLRRGYLKGDANIEDRK